MGYQVYFLQSENDAIQFLDLLVGLNAVIWTGNTLKLPIDLQGEIVNQMASYMCKYIILPPSASQSMDVNGPPGLLGIEFLICCKKNPLSRTFETGRLYYNANANNPHNAQTLALYRKLKEYIKTNYSYSRNSGVYFAPLFKQKFEAKYYFATQLGRPVIF